MPKLQVGVRSPLGLSKLEMRIYLKRCIPEHLQVPGMPEVRTMEVLMCLPLGQEDNGLHATITVELLQDPNRLIRPLETLAIRIIIGLVSPL